MRGWMVVALMTVAMTACAAAPQARPDERLYFAVELRRDGKLLAQPRLLGETGKALRAERRPPGAPNPDYRLALLPQVAGDHYQVSLDLSLPDTTPEHSELDLLHGEVRQFQVGSVQVQLLLMRVDSPEFRAMMRLAEERERINSARSI